MSRIPHEDVSLERRGLKGPGGPTEPCMRGHVIHRRQGRRCLAVTKHQGAFAAQTGGANLAIVADLGHGLAQCFAIHLWITDDFFRDRHEIDDWRLASQHTAQRRQPCEQIGMQIRFTPCDQDRGDARLMEFRHQSDTKPPLSVHEKIEEQKIEGLFAQQVDCVLRRTTAAHMMSPRPKGGLPFRSGFDFFMPYEYTHPGYRSC